jgi:hypothetical protein
VRCLRIAVAGLAVLASGLGAVAYAGDVTRTPTAVTYQATAGGAAEEVTLGVEGGLLFVSSTRGASTSDCTQTDPNRADCTPSPNVIVNLLQFNDILVSDALLGTAAVVAHGGGGDDGRGGALGADRLFGDDGNDRLDGKGGDDTLDGGTGEDTIIGGPGQDQIIGGVGDDTIDTRDGGLDTVDCGAGSDLATTDPADVITGCEAGLDANGNEVPLPAQGPLPGPQTSTALGIVVFTSSPTRLRVSPTGRFTYTFRATPGHSGTAGLTSARSLRIGSKTRRMKVGAKPFTAPASGTVKVKYKLSAASLRALRRTVRLGFKVSVALGGTTFVAKLTLLAPKRQNR